jgi:uncharacterized membrane protein YciS (DUF1049 family)
MKLLRRILSLFLLLAVIYILGDFIATNRAPTAISILVWTLGPYPTYLLIGGSFGVGIILMFLITALSLLRSRVLIAKQKQKISKLTREIEKQATQHD